MCSVLAARPRCSCADAGFRRRVVQFLLQHWSQTENQSVRISAYLRVRQMGEQLGGATLDACLKVR